MCSRLPKDVYRRLYSKAYHYAVPKLMSIRGRQYDDGQHIHIVLVYCDFADPLMLSISILSCVGQ